VVDIRELGLGGVHEENGALVIGATATLADVAGSALLREAANGVVAQAAHRTHASIQRNQATAAGTLIAEPDGIFSVSLAALDGRITGARLTAEGVMQEQIGLSDYFEDPAGFMNGSIILELVVPDSSRARRAALETVARTPRDRPIVSVCVAVTMDGQFVREAGVALGGVARTAWRAHDMERELLNQQLADNVIERAARAAANGLEPPSDFRGSAGFRAEMARVLAARALRAIAH
jgi:CO/xanthine dehydrogenase FAD-binding subunit